MERGLSMQVGKAWMSDKQTHTHRRVCVESECNFTTLSIRLFMQRTIRKLGDIFERYN